MPWYDARSEAYMLGKCVRVYLQALCVAHCPSVGIKHAMALCRVVREHFALRLPDTLMLWGAVGPTLWGAVGPTW
jgi:integral membrane sensor domain MASE1